MPLLKEAFVPPHRRLSIAICHPDLGIGGAERLIVDAGLELKAHGHDVHIFTAHHDKSRCFKETIDGSLPVTVYGDFLPRNIFGCFHAVCAYIRCIYVALAMIICCPPFEVVLADQVSAVIPILRLNPNTKVLFYCHFPDLLLAKRSSLLRQLYRYFIDWLEEITTGMADEIVVNSEYTAATFAATFHNLTVERGLRPCVLYPAVKTLLPESSLLKWASLDKRDRQNVAGIPGLPPDSRFFLSINRFERKKNIGLAIRAFAHLLRKSVRSQADVINGQSVVSRASSPGKERLEGLDNVRLVIAGGFDRRLSENREYLKELQALAQHEGVADSVIFVLSFSDDQKAALLGACICVIYTPENEHFGIVPLEAMAARKPVIACNSGGPKESIQHASTGFLCESTPNSFAAAMESLVKQPSRSEVMGRAARRHVEAHFSRKVFGDRLDEIVLAMVEKKQR